MQIMEYFIKTRAPPIPLQCPRYELTSLSSILLFYISIFTLKALFSVINNDRNFTS